MSDRFVNPVIKYTTSTLKTMPGAELYFYITGTTTPKTTYQDFELTIPHANPVVALSDGHLPPIFLDGSYRAELKYLGITQPGWPVDDIGATDDPAPLADWNSAFNYSSGALVTGPDGKRYESLQDNNLNNDPTAPGSLYWAQVFLAGNVDTWEQLDIAARSGPIPKADAESAIRYSLDLPAPSAFGFIRTNSDGTYTNRTYVETKNDLSLGNVSNTSDADKPVSTAQAATLAPKDSPILIGNPVAPTPAFGDNDTSLATTAFVQQNKGFFDNGAQGAPSITFASDTDTGIYRKGANSIAVTAGATDRIVVTSSGRVGVATESPAAKLHVINNNPVGDSIVNGCGIRSTCYWTGSTAQPYQNNDCTLFEVYNNVNSTSLNLSWGVSAANAYNNIPAGVVDSGNRVGVYGWAVSTPVVGYSHAGTLEFQFGVWGRAGFLASGSPATGVVNNAVGVRGEIVSDSAGTTIGTAIAGEFISTSTTGNVNYSYAIRANATNGDIENWSFHGDSGKMFNQNQALFGSKTTEMNSQICARGSGNNIEFGFSGAGYGSSLGATNTDGDPFIAFACKVDPAGETFTTSGQVGYVIRNELGADALIFGKVGNPSASGQPITESFRVDLNNRVQFQATPIFPGFAPASATAAGQTGQFGWDGTYLYICIGTNTWRRVAHATW